MSGATPRAVEEAARHLRRSARTYGHFDAAGVGRRRKVAYASRNHRRGRSDGDARPSFSPWRPRSRRPPRPSAATERGAAAAGARTTSSTSAARARRRRISRPSPSATSTARAARRTSTSRRRRASFAPGVKMVNAELGGVHGHPLKLNECFWAQAEEEGVRCGQQMVNDKVRRPSSSGSSPSATSRSTRRSRARTRSSASSPPTRPTRRRRTRSS